MAITLRQIGTPSAEDLVRIIKEVFADLEDQLNQRAQIYVSTTGTVPTNLNTNDVLLVAYKNRISILLRQPKKYLSLSADMIGGLLANGMNLKTTQTATIDPTIANFPNKNDFGFYHNTTTPSFYLCANIDGLFKKVVMT